MEQKLDAHLSFGVMIAYLLPGFTVLQGLPFLFADSSNWGIITRDDATFTVFLSGIFEALATGLTVSTLRWLIVDTIHHRTGVKQPAWNFLALKESTGAFQMLVQNHYQYYQFNSNMAVALIWRFFTGGYAQGWKGGAYLLLTLLFFIGSRDCLKKYYERAGRLLSPEITLLSSSDALA